MKCLNCNGDRFKVKKLRMSVDIKDDKVDVVSDSFVCSRCGADLMDAKQMNELRKKTADAYREKHGLLTSEEIVSFRKHLKMSQAEFAIYLNVGEASIKRWETYFIQDVSQDEHMRLKCDEAFAEKNALQTYWKFLKTDIYTGHTAFNLDIFKNVIAYLLQFSTSPLYLNKILFYLDFLHFKSFNKSFTGSRFIPLDYGPCPDQFQLLFSYLEKSGFIKKKGKHGFAPSRKADIALFDDREKETLEKIAAVLKAKGEKYFYDISHKERGFKETEFGRPISYAFAKDLLI